MPSRRLTLPAVAALALACIALGVLAALADGSGRTRHAAPRPRVVVAVPKAIAVARAARVRTPSYLRPAVPVAVAVAGGDALRPFVIATDRYARCGVFRFAVPVTAQAPAPEPVPDDLLHAFGILRRAATPDDALPKTALTALRTRGLEPFDPAAARLIRTTPDGGRAWVVPARDVPDTTACAVSAFPAPPVIVYNPKAPAIVTPVPVPRREAAPTTRYKAHPGLALVATGGAPVGAGGRYEDLIRGREQVTLDPCAGPDHDMLGVSGLVPDGVPAAFLTSPDGTAIRADVKDNAYNFVVPRSSKAETRYVVWTGGDGTPHVQPLEPYPFAARISCPALRHATGRLPSVSPTTTPPFLPAPVAVKPLPSPKRHK